MIPKAGDIISIIIAGPMTVGLTGFSLSLARKQEARFEQIFDGFKKFQVALLLIVPGVIAAFSCAMAYYILAGNDSIGPLEAISRSKEMMQGNKWKLFCLSVRFLGWAVVCVLTLGIGFLWVLPYMSVALARFYDDLKPASEGLQVIGSGQAITI